MDLILTYAGFMLDLCCFFFQYLITVLSFHFLYIPLNVKSLCDIFRMSMQGPSIAEWIE